jgi:hypothetical protein
LALLAVCGVSHREGYFNVFMVAIVGALIARAAVIVPVRHLDRSDS